MTKRLRLTTRTHGMLDFVMGGLLILVPWLVGFGDGPAGWTAAVVGLAVIVNSLLTDFELGRMRRLDIPVHLWIDGILGFFLGASPWLLEFDRTAWIPHLAAGTVLVLVALLSQTIPGYDRRSRAPAAE